MFIYIEDDKSEYYEYICPECDERVPWIAEFTCSNCKQFVWPAVETIAISIKERLNIYTGKY
jgi:hypothetical protein